MLDLRESSVYQIILDEGREEGRNEGREEGRTQGLTEGEIRGMARSVLQVGTERFGPPGPRISQEIRAIADLERLAHLMERLLKVSSWEDLLAPD